MLSDNIKILRKKKGYSQETLAEQLHVVRQTQKFLQNTEQKKSAHQYLKLQNFSQEELATQLTS